jgi:hypothetical protein
MTSAQIGRLLLAVGMGLALAIGAAAQGVELKSSATTYFGSAASCTQPATIDFDRVRDATPEWQTIRSEGIRKGSARYSLLISEMNARIHRACRKAAEEAGRDCVVGHRDIKDDRGLQVEDLTDAVVAKLESGELSP